MAIQLHCTVCKSSNAVKTRRCKTCNADLTKHRTYRVVVRGHDGKRVSKVVKSLSLARQLENKLRTQAMEKNLLGISRTITIDRAWDKYLMWAKDYKKSWRVDESRWELHIKQGLAGKRMDMITPSDVQNVITEMKSKSSYAPATIKQVLVLINRIYNWSMQMGLYEGRNPAARIKLPKLNNEITECLTRTEVKRLMETLDQWKNRRVALLVKFALYTGLRRGELFKLTWENVDTDFRETDFRNTSHLTVDQLAEVKTGRISVLF